MKTIVLVIVFALTLAALGPINARRKRTRTRRTTLTRRILHSTGALQQRVPNTLGTTLHP